MNGEQVRRVGGRSGEVSRRSACRLRSVLAGVLTLFVTAASASGGFVLVTPAEHVEARAAIDAGESFAVPKSSLGGPRIEVVSPALDRGPIAPPVDIEVRFTASEGATVDMSSLRVYYLMFIKKDVTERLLGHAEVGERSVRAEGAELPSGKHSFLLEISDSEQRKSSRKMVIEIAG